MAIEHYYEKRLEDGNLAMRYNSKDDYISIHKTSAGILSQHLLIHPDNVPRLIAMLEEIIKPEDV